MNEKKTHQGIVIGLALVAVVIILFVGLRNVFPGGTPDEVAEETVREITKDAVEEIIGNEVIMAEETRPSGLIIEELSVGDGNVAEPGMLVTVHYTGSFPDGDVFDSSVVRGTPFQFVLGVGQVIAGWDEGVTGMMVGGKRKLIIPPEIAYGDRGAGDVIPPGATLEFEVELLGVEKR